MYGGTKEEMQRLLTEAEKISGVHYEITNFKDSFELLSIITDYLLTFPKVFKYTLG